MAVTSPTFTSTEMEGPNFTPSIVPPEYVPIYRSGGSAEQGIRRSMEDAHVCVDDLEKEMGCHGAFYGVFDGHDGAAAACYVKEHLLRLILEDASFANGDVEDAVKRAYLELDKQFSDECRRDESLASGTTALSVLLQGRTLLVANAGDCRAVLSRKGVAVPMSTDHTPTLEKSRIESVGGFVTRDGYVNGHVSVARAIGDWHLDGLKVVGREGPVSALPEFQSTVLGEEDEFLLMGCDGFWEVFSNQGAVSFARKQLQLHNDPKLCSTELVMEALRRNSQDNVTVIVTCFTADAPPRPIVPERRRTSFIRRFDPQKLLNVINLASEQDKCLIT